MKHLVPFILFIGIQIFFIACDDSNTKKKIVCLPTQFPYEEENATITTAYDNKDRLSTVTYKFDNIDDVFRSLNTYDNKGNIVETSFYVNYIRTEDFSKVSYTADSIKESFYRTSALVGNLRFYRKYYLDGEIITGFTEHDKEDNFQRGDSTSFEYTGGNVTTVKVYDTFDVLQSTTEIEYDDANNPYYKANYSGGIYLYSILNLSMNNPTKYTIIETMDTKEYTYTYDEKLFPLTRNSLVIGEFKYTCN